MTDAVSAFLRSAQPRRHPRPLWLPVPRFSGYEVNAHGHVRNARTRARVVPQPNHGGYLRVRLSKDGRRTWAAVHVIVLEAFTGPRPPGTHGAHLDGKKRNNRHANLAWKPQAHNEADKRLHGTAPRGGARTATPGRTLAAIHRWLAKGASFTAVSKRFGIHRSSVSRIHRGLRRGGATA